jgi:hypothetical protein
MTCSAARRQIADFFDPAVQPAAALREHLSACARCAAAFEETLNAVSMVTPRERVTASPGFKTRTVERLRTELAAGSTRTSRWRFFAAPLPRLAIAGTSVLLLVLALPRIASLTTNRRATTLLAQSVQALRKVHTMHLTARMRSPERDNFEAIGANFDFVPVEMWKEFSTSRWRIEKPGRVVLMDGQQATLVIRPDYVRTGGPGAGFIEWIRPLFDPESVLTSELRAAQKGVSRATLRPEGREVVLTTVRAAEGPFVNGVGHNDSVQQSDHTRIYRFDAATGLLLGLQIVLHDSDRDVLVFEISGVRYDEPIPTEVWTLEIPEHAVRGIEAEEMPRTRPLPASAREAAAMFLTGVAQQDWDQVLMVYAESDVPEHLKAEGGWRVVSIGEAFQSGIYRGWYVPYELVLRDGTVKRWNLTVRNDNSIRRWTVDGGY